MDASDDFIAALFGGGGGDGDINIPSVQAQTPKKTAAPVDRGTETARANRKRRRAGLGTDLGEPTLGTPGLFGATQGF